MKDIHYIKDIESLKTISDSIRLSILLSLHSEPKSAQEIANSLDISRSKIHYHLNELENKGFIEVGKTEVKNGIIQKFYLPVAKAFVPDISIFNNHFFAGYKEIFVNKEKESSFQHELSELLEKYKSDETPDSKKITFYISE